MTVAHWLSQKFTEAWPQCDLLEILSWECWEKLSTGRCLYLRIPCKVPLTERCFAGSIKPSKKQCIGGSCCLLLVIGHCWKRPCALQELSEKSTWEPEKEASSLSSGILVPFTNKTCQTHWHGRSIYRVQLLYSRASKYLELKVNKLIYKTGLTESIPWHGSIFWNIDTKITILVKLGSMGRTSANIFKFFSILMVVVLLFWECVCKMSDYH